MLLALVLCVAQGTPSHAALHPAGADLFVESPDVPALLAAYDQAPMARLFADAESLGALRKLLAAPELTGTELLWRGLELMTLPRELAQGAVKSLPKLGAASCSLGRDPKTGAPGLLVVLDWRDEQSAEEVAQALEESLPEGAWSERSAARLALGAGALARETWQGLAGGTLPSLAKDAAFAAGAARLGQGGGAPVARGFNRASPLALAAAYAGDDPRRGLMELPAELLFGQGELHWRMSLAGGRFVSESFAPGATRPLAEHPWLAPAPFAPALLEEVHPQSLLAAGASFDPAALQSALSQSLGADLSAARVFDKLGRNLVLFLQPVRGMGLPRAIAVVELARSEGVLEDVAILGEALAANLPGTVVKRSVYKDVPYVSIDLPEGTLTFGDLGGVTPVLAVIDGRLMITDGSLSLKKEIRRRQGDEKEALGPASYPWTGGTAAFPKEATAVLYVDWAAQVDALFGLARAFGPMMESFNSPMPIDLAALPSPTVFTRHMPPTLHSCRPVEGGLAVRHEAGFAFETWVGLAGLAAVVMEKLEGGAVPAPVQPAPAAADPATDTRRTVLELRTAITVYKLDHGAFPDALARLVEPSQSYPSGYLDGRTALPRDAWGRDYRYVRAPDGASCRVWSVGPDGVDQDGAGDDVRDL